MLNKINASTVIIVILLGVIAFQGLRLHELNERLATPLGSGLSDAPTSTAKPHEQTTLIAELEATLRENAALRRAAARGQVEPDGIAGRVATLRDAFARLPEQQIPQLRYATEADWYAAVDGQLETVEDFRLAFARLRASAEGRFAKILQPALRAFMDANDGSFPQEPLQLQAFFSESVEPEILRHYKIVPADEVGSVRVGGDWAITQATLIDSELDTRVVIGPRGSGAYGGPRR